MPRSSLLLPALLVLPTGCAPLLADEALWARPHATLIAPTAEGLWARVRPSGGRARPVRLDTDPLGLDGFGASDSGTCDGPFAEVEDDDELLARGCAPGGYGHGMGAAGLGGLGTSGYGSGSGGFGGGGGGGEGALEPARRARLRSPLDRSPWGWAVVDLPYRRGPAARFEGREEAVLAPEIEVEIDHRSTFGVDVDTAAYAIARRALLSGGKPEPSLVRTEELLNAFRYKYPTPAGLVGITTDGARSPYDPSRYYLRVGVSAKTVSEAERRPVNLVFLIDTSCSMSGSDRLDLVKDSLHFALDELGPRDEVAIVTYAGQTKVALGPTPAEDREAVAEALAALTASGGTAMGSGLELAYRQAEAMHADGERTRVVVCSDGDANIGPGDADGLLAYVANHARQGVALSTVGFGDGNYRDRVMERLANEGDGAYHYVDAPRQARRVFGEELSRMLHEVARDVKVQVALDDDAVAAWRLVGYENRALAHQDFEDDAVDAGDVGSGHQVTALYELVLRPGARGRLADIKVRARPVDGGPTVAVQHLVDVRRVARPFAHADEDLRLAAAVVGFADHLRGAPAAQRTSMQDVLQLAIAAGAEQDPDRAELVALIERSISGT